MDENRDVFEVTDDQGNTSVVEVLDYFFYNGNEYAVMADYEEEPNEEEDQEIFFMSVTPVEGSEDEVEFNPIDDDLSQELFDVYTSEDPDDEEEE